MSYSRLFRYVRSLSLHLTSSIFGAIRSKWPKSASSASFSPLLQLTIRAGCSETASLASQREQFLEQSLSFHHLQFNRGKREITLNPSEPLPAEMVESSNPTSVWQDSSPHSVDSCCTHQTPHRACASHVFSCVQRKRVGVRPRRIRYDRTRAPAASETATMRRGKQHVSQLFSPSLV